MLVIASVFAGWQGVYASTTFSDREVPDSVTSLRDDVIPEDAATLRSISEEEALPSFSEAAASQLIPSTSTSAQEVGVDQVLEWPLGYIQASANVFADNGPPILVAVLDTGIDGGHKDLAGKIVANICFIEGTSTDDLYGHGTPIAGIIAADPDEDSGFIGLAPSSRLLNVKVADDRGRCRDSELSKGIIWAVDNGASVINISIEMNDTTTGLEEAVNYAWENGAIIVAAAGNDGNSQPVYPAAYEHCLSVTAIRENGNLAPLANYGDWVDVAAPGFDILTTLPDDASGYKHGTSFATAYVSGLAAILFSRVSDIDGDGYLNSEVVWAIKAGCHEIGIDGTGDGLIDVAASLAWASENASN